MISLEDIRKEMALRLSVDKEIKDVEVIAETVDEALQDASVQLGTEVDNLEYEVLEKGSDGFIGIGKKPWKLRVYPNALVILKTKKAAVASTQNDAKGTGEAAEDYKDAIFYIHRFEDNKIKLKVIPAVGRGAPVNKEDIFTALNRDDTENFDKAAIAEYIKNGTDGEYKEVGSFKRDTGADAIISIDIAKDESSVTMTVDEPGQGGAEVSFEQVMNALKKQGIKAGELEDKIKEFVDNPVYSVPYEVAATVQPQDGHDTYLEYYFETDSDKFRAKELKSGNIDFKELNNIQNVKSGQILAKRIDATRGKGGKTIYGYYIEAKNGKEISIQLGANVGYAEDGVSIQALLDGQVLLVNGKITVEPVMELNAVDIKSGNIDFVGSVVIKKNVEDGFNVKASGNIEVGGIVGKCNIESGGNIIISQGVFGKGEGSMKAKGSIWAKFVQDMKIEVEENLVVRDGLLNCDVMAMKNIVLYGKKAQITGGKLFATEEICARTLGSPGGGTTTELTVGVDPRAKRELDGLQESQSALVKELETIELDIGALENQRKVRKTLPEDKEKLYESLWKKRDEITEKSEKINEEIDKIQAYLRDLKAVGKVKIEGTVYEGTKIYLRDVLDEVKMEVKSCTFYYENAFPKRGKYEPPSLDISKGPGDGYATS